MHVDRPPLQRNPLPVVTLPPPAAWRCFLSCAILTILPILLFPSRAHAQGGILLVDATGISGGTRWVREFIYYAGYEIAKVQRAKKTRPESSIRCKRSAHAQCEAIAGGLLGDGGAIKSLRENYQYDVVIVVGSNLVEEGRAYGYEPTDPGDHVRPTWLLGVSGVLVPSAGFAAKDSGREGVGFGMGFEFGGIGRVASFVLRADILQEPLVLEDEELEETQYQTGLLLRVDLLPSLTISPYIALGPAGVVVIKFEDPVFVSGKAFLSRGGGFAGGGGGIRWRPGQKSRWRVRLGASYVQAFLDSTPYETKVNFGNLMLNLTFQVLGRPL